MSINAHSVLPAAVACAVVLVAGTVRGAEAAPGGPVRFNRDIRPILAENCYLCHGPDKNRRKAKLRLDVRESALEKGVLAPGKPEESPLLKRIFSDKADERMPPPEARRDLTPAQKELLRRWVTQGAEYEPHWAYIVPSRPKLPTVRQREWVRNPIDAFVLERLEGRGLRPSPEASRHALLRRLSLDLIGLPPTPGEVNAFLRDHSATAYERQVDRLLRSPHFGERMAAPWLDIVRFADTVGYHGDQNVNVFPYRDYVIDAFNQNMPFDRFTLEQLAGDQLPNPTLQQRVATGFNRLNMMTREGGAQPKEYLAKYAADRVRTVAATWLGSTMGCAECHDHKYDPFTTRDFYAMEAFFADVRQWGVYQDYGYTPNPDLKGWSNDHPFPPEIEVDSPYLHQRIGHLRRQIDEVCRAAASVLKTNAAERVAFERWRAASQEWLRRFPDGWAVPSPAVLLSPKDTNSLIETTFSVGPEGAILFAGQPGDNVRVKLELPAGWLAALRLELIPHDQHGGSVVRGGGATTRVPLSATLRAQGGQPPAQLAFHHADADHKEERYANGFTILGIKDVWATSRELRHSPQTAVWLLDSPVLVRAGDTLEVSLGKSALGCVRLAVSPFAPEDASQSALPDTVRKVLAGSSGARTRESRLILDKAWLLGTAWNKEAFARYKRLHQELLECRNGRSPTVVTAAWEPLTTRVLPRGNWQDESGEVVQPATPHFLPGPHPAEGQRLTRLDLARWMVSRDNPLTARTIMNRLWKQCLGTGISAVVDDLGAQGEWPTHPELLDWLAVEFMESGWDFKRMVRLMVLSATYRQESNPTRDLVEADPNNRLLACQTPRRLEAELVRDNALFIAGLLNLDLGGPSSHPYQPGGYYANLQFPDRDYQPEADERQYRRGVYAHWQRTFLHPMLANFDAPAREECTASRTVSNTPQQALTLLNDPSFVEAARAFAQKLLAARPAADEGKLARAYREALSRNVKPAELESLKSFLAAQRQHFRAHPEEARKLLAVGALPAPEKADPIELAAWTSVTRVILNLHETTTRY
jgi:hypothetical protein